tara:strand:- start:10277 stop:11449 length:1173 start_codon:yes stop_codon:yes gene_type:complete
MKTLLFEILNGITAINLGFSKTQINSFIEKWIHSLKDFNFILILAGSRTSEVEGISWAGCTANSRKYTALADAELLLNGPLSIKNWPLPPLPGGVSPALISYVASNFIGIKPLIISSGLSHKPTFPHICLDSQSEGPANCLSSGSAMNHRRVQKLWNAGLEMGLKMNKPLLITECVPGGTTTAHAVFSALGLEVSELISGSVLKPPVLLKKALVEQGLSAASLGPNPLPQSVLSAVGDPFQVIATGLLIGARRAGQPVLLGGGSQMLAVLALALSDLEPTSRLDFVKDIAIATTSWLVDESNDDDLSRSSFISLMNFIAEFFEIKLLGFASGLRFHSSNKKVLRDYEIGYVKEGVGAGALSFLAKLKGITLDDLIKACELAVEQLDSRGH